MLRISNDLLLPIDVAGEAIAILAKRGAGKTNTATVLVEEMLSSGVQVVVLDPVGVWWGLRGSGSGNDHGFPVAVLGGERGDVPLEASAGSLIADVAVDTEQPLVLDLSEFSKRDQRHFVADFAQRLYRRKAKARSTLHVVLEEADEFAPQRVTAGDAPMVGAISQIVKRGRSRGLGMTVITQRSASLNKDVLDQADVLIVMRTTGPRDRKAVEGWIEHQDADGAEDVLPSLPGLDTGVAWIWNPERSMLRQTRVRHRGTFDSSQTPRPGEKRAEPKRMEPIDLEALGAKIAATAEQAKANDPRELRRRINELEKQLARQPVKPVVETVEKIVEVSILTDEDRVTLSRIAGVLEKGTSNGSQPRKPGPAQVDRRPARPHREHARRPDPPAHRDERGGVQGDVTGPQQRVLDALAWLDSIGLPGDRLRVGFLAGYSPNSGNFNNLLGGLRTSGLLDYPGPGQVALTEAGEALASPPAETVTTEQLHEKVLSKLKGPQRRVLEDLISRYPEPATREEVAETVGYSPNSGNFNNILGSMRTLGIIDYPSRGYVVCEPLLFLEDSYA
jgi:hypothetical protein